MTTRTLARGKLTRPSSEIVQITELHELTRADLSVLEAPRPPQRLQSLKDTHHRLARAVAAGMRNFEIAETCGTSINRISVLKQDPAFMELVAHYRGVITAEFAELGDPVVAYLRTNAAKAQAMLSDKLDDAAAKNEFLPTRDLLGIAELGLDRTGYGKVNKNLNVNVDFAAHLEAARQRASLARTPIETAPDIIDGEVVHSPDLAPGASNPASPPQAPASRR